MRLKEHCVSANVEDLFGFGRGLKQISMRLFGLSYGLNNILFLALALALALQRNINAAVNVHSDISCKENVNY